MTALQPLAAGVLAPLTVWLLGASALALAGLREGRGRDLALDFAAGVALLGLLGSTVIAAGGRVSMLHVYFLLVALVGAAVVRCGAGSLAVRLRLALPRDRIARGILAVAGAVLLVVVTAAFRDRVMWDGWTFWMLKSRALLLDGTIPPAMLDPAGPYDYAHPDYPLGLPLLQWWAFVHAGGVVPALVSFLGALWFVLLVLLFGDTALDLAGERPAALAVLGVAAFWPIAQHATGGYADVVVTLALLGAVVHLREAAGAAGGARDAGMAGTPATAGTAAVWRAAVFLALAAVTKNEGLALAMVAAATGGAWLAARRRLRPAAVAALLLPLAVAAPWTWFVAEHGLRAAHLGSAGAAVAWGERVGTLASHYAGLALHRSWVPLPWILALGLVGAFRGRRADLALPWMVVLLYFAALNAVYLTTGLDLDWLLTSSLERVLQPLVPAGVLLALLALFPRSQLVPRRHSG